jgi:hypothetical protein
MLDQTALERKLEKLEAKLEKTDKDFFKDTRKLSAEELKKKALDYAQEMERVDAEQLGHKKLGEAKSVVKDLNKGFSDSRKFAKLKMQAVLAIMQEKDIK